MDLVLSREQVRRVDQLAIERYGLPGLVLMENAGRNAAEIIRRAFPDAGDALVLCGSGNNGGDGLVIARHLHNAGWGVRLILVGDETALAPDTRTHFGVVSAMNLPIARVRAPGDVGALLIATGAGTVLVDALLGTGFRGAVRSPYAELIHAAGRWPRRAIVAVDAPSGMDCDSGEPSNAIVCADLTVTFVAMKRGFARPGAAAFLGRVEVADIGAPREMVERIAEGDETC